MEMHCSSELLFSNLLIGLTKGLKRLQPYSIEFQKNLGYKLFRFEQKIRYIKNGGGTIHPDCIIISEKLNHTIIFEWTNNPDPEIKQDQFRRYGNVEAADLIDNAAVPPNCCNNYSMAIVIFNNDGNDNYVDYFHQNAILYPLLFFENHSDVTLEKIKNKFLEKNTEKFFNRGIKLNIRNIPLHYLPFSLNNITHSELVAPVIQSLVGFIVKEEKVSVSCDEICEDILPLWKYLSFSKKKEIRDKVKELIRSLSRDTETRSLIERDQTKERASWKLNTIEFFQHIIKYQNELNNFINEIQGNPMQPLLPYEEF